DLSSKYTLSMVPPVVTISSSSIRSFQPSSRAHILAAARPGAAARAGPGAPGAGRSGGFAPAAEAGDQARPAGKEDDHDREHDLDQRERPHRRITPCVHDPVAEPQQPQHAGPETG